MLEHEVELATETSYNYVHAATSRQGNDSLEDTHLDCHGSMKTSSG